MRREGDNREMTLSSVPIGSRLPVPIGSSTTCLSDVDLCVPGPTVSLENSVQSDVRTGFFNDKV